MNNPDNVSRFHALLIGISHYLPKSLPGQNPYVSLRAAHSDAAAMESFLKSRLRIPDEQIIKLISEPVSATESPEKGHSTEISAENLPTFAGIHRAFRQLMEETSSGDHVLIFYSGHGGRALTMYPEIKGAEGLDEALVPMDIGNPEGQYIRDIELGYIIQSLINKGVGLSMIFDCCHSGGTLRAESDENIMIKGILHPDTTERSMVSPLASREMLMNTWRSFTGGAATRNASERHNMLPKLPGAGGYALLAACRPNEYAMEGLLDIEKGLQGFLTHYLMNALYETGGDMTFYQLHKRIHAQINSIYKTQNPQILGEQQQVIFGGNIKPVEFSASLAEVNHAQKQVVLNTGLHQGVRKGYTFTIYPNEITNFNNPADRQAIVEVFKPEATDSQARIITEFEGKGKIQQGANAVFTGMSTLKQRAVRLLVNQPRLKELIENDKSFIKLATQGKSPVFQVNEGFSGELIILNAEGMPLPNLVPAILKSESEAERKLMERLSHLAKYMNVVDIGNSHTQYSVSGELEMEVHKIDYDAKMMGEDYILPHDSQGGLMNFRVGDTVMLRVKNTFSKTLNFAVLDLKPDWGIQKIHPNFGHYEELKPDETKELVFDLSLPNHIAEGEDIIKLFVSEGSVNFDWLQLPSMVPPGADYGFRPGSVTRGSGNPLEDLISDMATGKQVYRNLASRSSANTIWGTHIINIKTRR